MDTQKEFEAQNSDSTLLESYEVKRMRVVLLNDDYTTQEFVIALLQAVFEKDFESAINLMLQIHHNGRGVAGIYPYDIAELKAQEAKDLARSEGFPLRVILEEI